MDPENQSIWKSLRSCQEAYDKDKKIKFAEAEKERLEEAARQEIKDKLKAKQNEEQNEEKLYDFLVDLNKTEEKVDKIIKEEDVGLLDDFFSEINTSADKNTKELEEKIKSEIAVHDKYTKQDLGDPIEQVKRLTQENYKWKNLNPFYVLQLGIDATSEDIKNRYRKMSVKVHPDKLHDVKNAKEAFEEVKSAYNKLLNDDQRKTIILHIEEVRDTTTKERRKLVIKGMKDSDLPPLEEEIAKNTMKRFADIELQRRRSEYLAHAYNNRDRMLEDEKKEIEKIESDMEKEWSEIGRREKRVDNWRSFQVAPDAKKMKTSSYKEELRDDIKHGKVKKNWK